MKLFPEREKELVFLEQTIVAIAYLSKTGRGSTPVEPFINDDIEDIADALEQKEAMERQGLQGVKVFAYDADAKPDYITWSFVRDHLVKA